MNRIPRNLCEIHSLGVGTREWLVGKREVAAFENLNIRVAGYTDARTGYEFVRHYPLFSQALACVDGEGEVLVDGAWHRCGPGTVYLTAPRALCAYHIRRGRRWRVCWVIYEERERLPTLVAGEAPRLMTADSTGLHLAIEGVCREAAGAAEPALIEHWATLVHRQVLRLLEPANHPPQLGRLWSTVRQDLGGAWDLARLARHAGMSAESLRRLCQQHEGRSPCAHLTHLRMQFAADLLTCSQEKVSSIAARVGYGDEFAFSNAFKREWGVPPSRYRAKPAKA